jgi:hypothetical protein
LLKNDKRRLRTVGDGWRRLGTVGDGWGQLETVGDGWGRLGTVGGGGRGWYGDGDGSEWDAARIEIFTVLIAFNCL